MYLFEFAAKWKGKIDDLIRRKDIIPEIDVKVFLKENFFELSVDIDAVFQETREKPSLSIFVNEMIDYALESQPKVVRHAINPKPHKPNLDYYDNQRDRYADGELVAYKGTFGAWSNN